MDKQTSNTVVKYKPLSAENDSAFKTERSLDTIVFSGSYSVEITHNGTDVGLPIDDCGDEHYIVGTLVVTDSGTGGRKQKNRVIGQALTITSRQSKNTKVYTRTLVNGHWSSWIDLGAAKTTDIQDGAITMQKLSRDVQAKINKNSADATKSLNAVYWTSDPNVVTLNINKNDGTVGTQTLPAATEENAGVMSADMLNAIAANADVVEKKVISPNGSEKNNDYYDSSVFIEIPSGIIDVSAIGYISGSAMLVAFYDIHKTFISGYGNFGDAKATFYSAIHFPVPENARYVRFSRNREWGSKTVLIWGNTSYNKSIEALLPIYIEWIDGEYVNRGGVIANSATWCRSDYLDVADIAGVTIKAYNRGTVLACAFYDADYKYISGVGDLGYTAFTKIHTNVVVPANARYMRVSTTVVYKNDTVFYANGMRNIATEKEDSTKPDIESTQIIPANFYRKQSGDSLRILCFGSSWLTNTWWYLNKMTNAAGINATIKCYFSSGCPFSKWVDRYEGKEETGTSTDFRRFDSVNGSDWSVEYVTDTTEFRRSLEDDWDVIVFQQGAFASVDWDGAYEPYYSKLVSYIKRSAKPWTVICYNNTWTPKLGTAPISTKEEQKEWQRLNNENCIRFTNLVGLSNFVIPCGSAVWALRNDTVITSVDDFVSVENNTATYSDNLHLKNGLPLYLTGLTLFRSIVTPFYGIDIDDITWLPDESTNKNPASGKSWMPIDREQAARLKDMVKLAFSNRYGFYTL